METNQLEIMRHSAAHLVAAAVLKLYPQAKFGVGPVIENGFYYDIDFTEAITEDALGEIEKQAKKMLAQNLKFERTEIPINEAIKFFQKIKQDYKVELLNDLKTKGTTKLDAEADFDSNGTVSLYQTGDFIDLCRGPHVDSTKEIGALKLIKLAGAYWRGDEKNKMLTRIYGLCFATSEELAEHLNMLSEAEKRDHRKLGKELGLFAFSDLVGSGLPLFLPKGAILMRELGEFMRQEKIKRGYSFVQIPHITKATLYETSGHLGKYDAMMPLMTDNEGTVFALKAMNCPHHFEMFNAQPHSYRDLPLRFAENTTVYRNEKSGELSGLLRVKALTQDDTHHFVRHDQIGSEIKIILDLMDNVYRVFGFAEFTIQISVRDKNNKEKYFGSDDLWEKSENILIEAVKNWNKPYVIKEGEAAFYGPKIDIMVKDAIGRLWQLTTVQLDFNQPENFDLHYIDENGAKVRPAVLHVAILGSLERFLGVLIEHFAGNFPLWLAPVQVKILSVGENHIPYCEQLLKNFHDAGVRAELDDKNESVGHKIRQSSKEKIPYVLVIGDKEMNSKDLDVRVRGQEDLLTIAQDKFKERLQKLISTRSLEL